MPQGYDDPDWKAQGITLEDSSTEIQLFTAEDEIKTAPIVVLTGQVLAFGTIVAANAAGKAVPWAPAAGDVTAKPIGVIATAIDTTNPAGDRHAEIYEGGCFNPNLLVWPAALDTYLERNSALRSAGAPFRVKRLL